MTIRGTGALVVAAVVGVTFALTRQGRGRVAAVTPTVLPTAAVHDGSGAGRLRGTVLQGYTDVLLLRLTRWLYRARPRPSRAVAGLALVGLWPLALNMILLPLPGPLAVTTWEATGWIAALGVLCIGMAASTWVCWRRLARASDGIGRLLVDPEANRRLSTWLRRRQARAPQVVAGALAAIAGMVYLAAVEPAISSELQIRFVSYLSVGWTSFVGGQTVYWTLTMGELPIRLYRGGALRLVDADPAYTPAIIDLARGYMTAAMLLLVGLLSTEALGLALPARDDSWLVLAAVIGFPIFGAIATTYFGFQPLLSIHLMVQRHQAGLLRTMVDDDNRLVQDTGTEAAREFSAVAHADTIPLRTASLVQFGAAVVGPLAAYLFEVIRA